MKGEKYLLEVGIELWETFMHGVSLKGTSFARENAQASIALVQVVGPAISAAGTPIVLNHSLITLNTSLKHQPARHPPLEDTKLVLMTRPAELSARTTRGSTITYNLREEKLDTGEDVKRRQTCSRSL